MDSGSKHYIERNTIGKSPRGCTYVRSTQRQETKVLGVRVSNMVFDWSESFHSRAPIALVHEVLDNTYSGALAGWYGTDFIDRFDTQE
jgi:hypothetical protein